MAAWVERHVPDTDHARILDIGAGNGHLLIELAERGYRHLVGIDYSAAAVDLARRVVAGHDEELVRGIRFETVDFLDAGDTMMAALGGFDVLLDKGTFDAISLKPVEEETVSLARDNADEVVRPPARRMRDLTATERYAESIVHLLSSSSGSSNPLFLITSCNWTEDELRRVFESAHESRRGLFMDCA